MELTVVGGVTPWFPDDMSISEDPCVVTTGSRGSGALLRRRVRDADHYDEDHCPNNRIPFDAFELQDDSFVNFSIGNLDRRNFSLLGGPRFVRQSSASPRHTAEHSSQGSSNGSGRWRLRRRRKTASSRLSRAESFFDPVRKCFV